MSKTKVKINVAMPCNESPAGQCVYNERKMTAKRRVRQPPVLHPR